MGVLELLFGSKKKRIKAFLDKDAVIIDVRTQQEWDKGHIKTAKHVPLHLLKDKVSELKALNKPLILCCQSGVRSVKAAKYLQMHNLEATDGGGWRSLEKIVLS
ncbi:rhodanese-like domain-containing protein [Subsaximicrobium wynnwilliamsii]|uniref:Rhodanese-like domain-containing protein n=1 Tax=Subsaximicrobium wynnwilliamsii TaxID=291179 RepID=A0A5C6ZKA0_9FLAO|nr:rhodanese-like domain-containing protein [Subsaximicrobium wynnwilliamsii]TXD85398.1 rhodanese-like domain-containing protein [Subsaximicrobium wynnwilliamsii]TXD90751.1 rhodanese-like domain-containing protein [Subsaximicrobium wynnwilliamsii]TXE05258.1 rhodanese-like domain-containing protein [Subsaximicrobium wynnwilliamsii]